MIMQRNNSPWAYAKREESLDRDLAMYSRVPNLFRPMNKYHLPLTWVPPRLKLALPAIQSVTDKEFIALH